MSDQSVQQRIVHLCTGERGSGPVVYWMQASQRVKDNLSLGYAAQTAVDLNRKLVVVFGLTDDFPEANRRHYQFMLEGLSEVQKDLEGFGIGFAVRLGKPFEAVTELPFAPALVVTDAGYLWEQRFWRKELVEGVEVPVVQVEDNIVVPVRLASQKEEYAAYTIRKKINRHRDAFLETDSLETVPSPGSPSTDLAHELYGDKSLSLSDGAERICERLSLDDSVAPSEVFNGGSSAAEDRLESFVTNKLAAYDESRSDPSLHIQSDMSPYLHFGQISPRVIARAVRDADAPQEAKDAFLEELVVRRELAINYVYYNRRYRSFDSLPGWAQETLEDHRSDKRVAIFSRADLEAGSTDDPYWNAAMREMRITGKMHNYMRMYWGKRFIEWHSDPEDAFDVSLAINNKYFLDGRDANSFAGVAWCFGKHDRPWPERDIFGKVRYMNANGLKRKFDIEEYVRWTQTLGEE